MKTTNLAVMAYYYVREPYERTKPLACVAIGRTVDGKVCRGVSVCSDLDQWTRADARKHARDALLKAVGTQKSWPFKRHAVDNEVAASVMRFWSSVSHETGVYQEFNKSGYAVMPTPKEEVILSHAERNLQRAVGPSP